jgi:acyl-CoA thioester hydrolase
MPLFEHVCQLRIRYSETDQMGTFYNSKALDWFECGRTELLRAAGLTYADMEVKGIQLPLTEAHVEYQGRARYDDLLEIKCRMRMAGRARLRFAVQINHVPAGIPVVSGYTIHAVTEGSGRPIRPPRWLLDLVRKFGSTE